MKFNFKSAISLNATLLDWNAPLPFGERMYSRAYGRRDPIMEILEFLPLEKKSVDKKRKKSFEGLKRQRVASSKKISKKTRNDKVKKLVNSESDDIDVENKSAVEGSTQEISHQVKEISEDKKTEKSQVPRLFVNMKRVIMNEEIVKEIHPDIISIKFPRKKRSRWCWAVFASEKKAEKAFNKLRRRNDILVTKPHEQLKENARKKIKPLNSELKKSLKTKLREAWM